MTAAELARLSDCAHCGASPTAPLGELCPDGDGSDFHWFPLSSEGHGCVRILADAPPHSPRGRGSRCPR